MPCWEGDRWKMEMSEDNRIFDKSTFGLVKGDMVYPSSTNPHFKVLIEKGFPWKVHKVHGLTLWIERPSKNGKIRLEKWFAGYWRKALGEET